MDRLISLWRFESLSIRDSSPFIVLFNRIILFIIYFWFGILKVIKNSPAHDLVVELFNATHIPLMSTESFVLNLGIFECILGLLWLIPKFTKITFAIFIFHIIMTFLPFIFISDITNPHGADLSLVGQYIIKNLALIGCALSILLWHKSKV